MRNSIKAHLALLAATLIFAVNYWVSKDLVGNLSVVQLVFFRTIGASLLFAILFFLKPAEKVSSRDKWLLAVAAAFGVALNQLLFFGGLQYTTPVDTATIHVSNPVIVMTLSAIFLKIELRRTQLLGVALGAIGALVLVLYQKEFHWGGDAVKGNLMVLGNTTAYAVFLVMMKPILKKYSPLTATFWVYLFASLMILPLGIRDMFELPWTSLLASHGLALFYIIVMVTFVAYFLSIYGLKKLSPTVVSFYIYLQPVFAFLIAVALREQLPEMLKILATLLIFLGVYLVNKKSRT